MKRTIFDRVTDLLGRVPRPPGDRAIVGASDSQLASLEARLGYRLPSLLAAWLTVCNGLIAGPGGLYGASPPEDFLGIDFMLGLHPEWAARKWLPVAGDGNGNQYIMDASREHIDRDSIFFVDTSEDDLALCYIVGSTLPLFLEFLLEREMGSRGWPFDPAYVLARDAAMASVVPERLLPWNA